MVDVTAAPCRFCVAGETKQVELAGAPLQDRATVPVRPPIGVTVML